MINGISADHIAGQFEPQRTNNFIILFPIGAQLIRKALNKFPIPKDSNPPIIINYGNEQRKVAGAARFTNAVLELVDYIDSDVLGEIEAWADSVYEPRTGQIGYAQNYKVNATVKALGPDGAVSREWTLWGMFPTVVDPGQGDMSANVDNKISITFRVDKVFERNL